MGDNASADAVKACTKCGVEKPLSAFSKDSRKSSGLRASCKDCTRKYEQDNASHIAERKRQYYIANVDRYAQHDRQYYEANANRITAYKRAYYRDNVKHIAERHREYYKKHPENYLAACHRRRARKLAVGGTHSAADIYALIAGQTDRKGVLRCWHCGKPITGQYHVDHFIPLDKGGSNDAGNLRITHPKCNLSKGAKMPAEFNGRLL